MYDMETLRVSYRTDSITELAYYVFDDEKPKTRVIIWARGELQPMLTQESYDRMLNTDSQVESVPEPYFCVNELYTHVTTRLAWTPVTELEMVVVTGLTPDKCREILWGITDEEDQATKVFIKN